MIHDAEQYLRVLRLPRLENATLVLAFSGWMDGGDVSTGTVSRLIDLASAPPIAEIDPEPFYISSFPGSMEVTALFRPHIEIENGLVKKIEMPSNRFHCHEAGKVLFFVGEEPQLCWRTFGDCILKLAKEVGVKRILFVGSFGGTVPHTRQPRLFVTCSDESLLPGMEQYGMRRSDYSGPGSFTTYLMTRAPAAGIEMSSLVAEIPGYLQGVNPSSIEAVTRRLAAILKLPLNLDALRSASTEWELQVSSAVEQDAELEEKVRKLEEAYDNELLESGSESEG